MLKASLFWVLPETSLLILSTETNSLPSTMKPMIQWLKPCLWRATMLTAETEIKKTKRSINL